MGRINGLMKLIFSNIDSLRPSEPFRSEGARADILRTIVVFLHATFEDLLRTRARQPNKKMSFYSGADIDKVLRQSGLDPRPFKPLYPPLSQMAKRRKRIVHDADLSKPTDTVPEAWTIADDFQLIMWMLAVPAFYSQLRLSVDPTDELQRWYLARRKKAIELALEVGKEIIALGNQPKEELRLGLQKVTERLAEVLDSLGGPSDEEILAIWKKMKSPDDDTSDEQARAKIGASRDKGK
jgi:hypothetical protein